MRGRQVGCQRSTRHRSASLDSHRRAHVQPAQLREADQHWASVELQVALPFARVLPGDERAVASGPSSSNPYDSGQWPKFVGKRFMRPAGMMIVGGPPTLVFGVLAGAELAEGLLPVPKNTDLTHYAIVDPFDPKQLPVVEAVLGSAGLRKLPRVPRGARWCIRWSAGVAPIPRCGALVLFPLVLPCKREKFCSRRQARHGSVVGIRSARRRAVLQPLPWEP